MTYRYDNSPFVAGKFCYRQAAGLGYLGSEIPSTGTDGGSIYYPSLEPGDMGLEVRGLLIEGPSAGLFKLYEDGSFSLTEVPDGTYTAVVEMFLAGESQGELTATFHVNDDTVVASSYDGAYAIIGIVQKSLSSEFGIREAVASDYDAGYTISGIVTKNLDGTFNVIGKITKDLDSDYEILAEGVVISSYDASYSVMGSAQKDLSQTYGITSAVARTNNFSYGVTESVAEQFDSAYGIRSAVNKDLTAGFSILGAVQASLSSGYHVDGESGPCPTVEQIAEAVWSYVLTGPRVPGSSGSMVQDTANRVAATL